MAAPLTRHDLFTAIIQEDHGLVKTILEAESALLIGSNEKPDKVPAQLFKEHRFEYIATGDILRHLSGQDATPTKICNQTALHLACIMGHVETVKFLLEKGTAKLLDGKNGSNETVLGVACRAGHLEVALVLLDKGFKKISPEMDDDDGNSPLDHLIHQGSYPGPDWSSSPTDHNLRKVTRILVERLLWKTPPYIINQVVKFGRQVIFEGILEALPDKTHTMDLLSRQDGVGWTPLHCAASEGQQDMLEKLLKKWNSSCGSKDKQTDEQISEMRRRTEQYLTTADNTDWTALHYAANWGHLEIVKRLVDQWNSWFDSGKDEQQSRSLVNAREEDGWTALHLAAAAGRREVVEYLLSKHAGANPYLKTQDCEDCDAGILALRQCDDSEAAEAIRTMIVNAQNTGQDAQDKLAASDALDNSVDCAKCRPWIWQPDFIAGTNIGKGKYPTVRTLIEEARTKEIPKSPTGLLWCHLPANKQTWMKYLCERFSAIKDEESRSQLETFIQQAMEIARQVPLNHEQASETLLGPDTTCNTAVIIPIIDIDLLSPGFVNSDRMSPRSAIPMTVGTSPVDEKHKQHMSCPMQTAAVDAHRVWTLDEYVDADLKDDKNKLHSYNTDQVLSRWLHKQHQKRQRINQEDSSQIALPLTHLLREAGTHGKSAKGHRFRSACRAIWGSIVMIWKLFVKCVPIILIKSDTPTSKWNSGSFNDLEKQSEHPEGAPVMEPDEPDKIEKQTDIPNQLVLVISQLWVFKLNRGDLAEGGTPEVLITSYPERWHQDTALQALPKLSTALQRMVDSSSKGSHQGNKDGKTLLHRIVKKSMEFRAEIPAELCAAELKITSSGPVRTDSTALRDKRTSYLSMFSKETWRISHEVDRLYKQFRDGLEKVDEQFADYTKAAVEYLLDIQDVIDEIVKVIGVLEHQLSLWKELHNVKKAAGAHEQAVIAPSDADTAQKTSESTSETETDIEHIAREVDRVGGEQDVRRACSAHHTSQAPEPHLKTETASRPESPSKCPWDDTCDPNCFQENKGALADAKKIEAHATKVYKKTEGLLGLLNGEASTAVAIKSFEQAKYLEVFTLMTVVFTPISFVMSMFALQYYPQGTWTGWQVGVGSAVSIIITAVVCLVWIDRVKWGKERARKKLRGIRKHTLDPWASSASEVSEEKQIIEKKGEAGSRAETMSGAL